MVFRKQKMIDRITKEGRADMFDAQSLTIMDNLDGCEASASNWQRVVIGEPVMYVVGKNGKGDYVNELDCE